MVVKFHRDTQDDLLEGYDFYERQQSGLGSDFYESIISEAESRLPRVFAIKPRVRNSQVYRLLCEKFSSWAIYYRFDEAGITVLVFADCRRDPEVAREKLDLHS